MKSWGRGISPWTWSCNQVTESVELRTGLVLFLLGVSTTPPFFFFVSSKGELFFDFADGQDSRFLLSTSQWNKKTKYMWWEETASKRQCRQRCFMKDTCFTWGQFWVWTLQKWGRGCSKWIAGSELRLLIFCSVWETGIGCSLPCACWMLELFRTKKRQQHRY